MKTARIVALIMAAAVLLCACQPTPEKPPVVGKNTDLVKEIVNANSNENKPELENDKQIINNQIKELGGHMEMQMKPNPQVTINVDADIVQPGDKQIPLVRVRPKNLSKEQFETFAGYLSLGEPLYYETFDEHTANSFTKEEIAAILPRIKGYLADDDLPEYIRNGWADMVSELENNYDSAISKADEKPYDGTLTEAENNKYFSTITQLKCYKGKDIAARLSLWQSFNEAKTQITFDNNNYGSGYNTFEPYEGVDAKRLDITYEEAKVMAENFVRKIDGEDTNFVVYKSSIGYEIGTIVNYTKETSSQAYAFSFARSYNGVEVIRIGYLRGVNEQINYNKQVSPESILIVIDDDGINIAYWGNQTEYIETVSEDVPLLDFDTIKETFEEYCNQRFTWVPHDDALPSGLGVTFNVKRVELNLMVIPEKDNLENYITVPVWDFIADMKYDGDVVTQEGYPAEGEKDISILTINAINGSIIDREQGY